MQWFTQILENQGPELVAQRADQYDPPLPDLCVGVTGHVRLSATAAALIGCALLLFSPWCASLAPRPALQRRSGSLPSGSEETRARRRAS
jgi:hypothetical protein